MRTNWRATVVSILVASAAWPALAAEAIPAGARFVAMGSSFAAGSGITPYAPDGIAGCNQSADNYARQLARRRGLQLVDRSCGGATTTHVLVGGQDGQPAQLDALTPDTRLVTLTIAGNDVRLTGDLMRWSCNNARDSLPPGATCPEAPPLDREQAFVETERNLRAIAAEVRKRAPRARLIVVDYVTLLPPTGTCPALSLTPAQADEARAIANRLAAVTDRVARESGADIVKASALTVGHDACSAQPWANGYLMRGGAGATGWHPNRPAHTAVAEAIDTLLR